MTDPPIIRLIEQITGFPRELVLKILGYIPVRRRLTIETPLEPLGYWDAISVGMW